MPRQILEGIRVIEWSAWLVGPVAGAMLAQLGAEVIKVEQLGRGDPQRGWQEFQNMSLMLPGGREAFVESANSSKKSIAVDMGQKAGRQIVYDLVSKSDVFLTNMRPQIVAKLGMDYGALSQYNPKLIYAPVSSFGERGPDSQLSGLDVIAQARGGLMMASGEPDWPPVWVAVGVSDNITGIMAAYGVVAALLARERFGIGQQAGVSMLSATMALQKAIIEVSSFVKKQFPKQKRTDAKNPMYNWYRCQDGKWIVLALLQAERYWPAFVKAIGKPELECDARFVSVQKRKENCQELASILDEVFARKPYEEWDKIFRKADFLFSPVQSIGDLFSDRQILENEYLIDVDHPDLGRVKYVGNIVNFSETPGAMPLPAPHCGQHTEEVLHDVCGYTWEKIGGLKEQGVI